MKKFFLLTIFTFSFCFSSSQKGKEYVVPFEYKTSAIKTEYVTIGIIYSNQISNYSFFSGIPLDIPTFRIYSVSIDKPVPQEANNNLFYFYVGLDKSKGFKYLIVDSNVNLDFRDDKLYKFSLSDYKIKSYTQEQYALCPEIQIDYKDPDQNEFLIDLFFNPFYSDKSKNAYPSEDDFFLDFGVFTNSYLQGTFNINKDNIVINEHKSTNTASLLPQKQLSEKSIFTMFIQNDTVFSQNSRIGDTVSIANRKIYLKGFRENKLFLKDMGELSDSSRTSSYLPDLYSTSLSDSTAMRLNDLMKNKYVFIDFWGSWCAPCIASIPKMKELYDKIKEKPDALIIGIALDKEQDLDKLRKIIQDYKINWLNVWDDYNKLQILSSNYRKMNIKSFPTYVIINKQGEIMYKKAGEIEKAIDFFISLISE